MRENKSKSAAWPIYPDTGRGPLQAQSGQRRGGSCPLSAKNIGSVAPGFPATAERLALDMLVSGMSAAAVAKQLSALDRRTEAEAVLRLVEFGTGPLGRVRAARGDSGIADGADTNL